MCKTKVPHHFEQKFEPPRFTSSLSEHFFFSSWLFTWPHSRLFGLPHHFFFWLMKYSFIHTQIFNKNIKCYFCFFLKEHNSKFLPILFSIVSFFFLSQTKEFFYFFLNFFLYFHFSILIPNKSFV